ncbi:MAG: hypothetical protein HQK59_02685 [Deltaproteobacteria bacterium]|nr:hypothetical protein [Deltaproteobacteria bacterium]
MKISIFDTSALIRLKNGDALNCLQCFDKIYIPVAVQNECLDPISSQIIKKPPFEVHEVKTVLNLGVKLGLGETEAISLAVELNIKDIVIDDKDAVKKALQQGLEPVSSLQLLIIAKHDGIIDSVVKVTETMKANGENLDEHGYLEALNAADEIPDHDPSPLEDMQPMTSDAPLPSPSVLSNQHEDQEEETKKEESGVL